ncbi:RNA polymerase sigma factor [Nocardioides bruguierae]|uniref:RNA polymerase sigma factor n=1 Tax=Nocardioides bruguierae TaxID=2945102 RepID=A0A9X2D6L0_9ACTN|nr:RNA polymerase sigma factor [Nocardioides bruguierae]MCL8024028.1 RNA polymerase sigma factor [Nocardioides bruguierae]MCM0620307.1 RNA polymerase sigma factor [Nocardioides bruguierae]
MSHPHTEPPTPDQVDDLARRAAAGEREAMEQLLAAVRPRALAVCRGVLPHPADAEDACQDALLNVATKVGTWHGRGRFTTWMHTVCVNSARSTYRRLSRQASPVDVASHPRADRPDPRTTSVVAGTRLDLLEAMEVLERDHPQLVQPLLLRDVYELPYDEIATLLDLPLGTVKAQIHTGRRLTRPLLRDLTVEPR